VLQKALLGVGKTIATRILIDVLGLDDAVDELLNSGSGDGDESVIGSDTTGSGTTGSGTIDVFYGRR
jgi:hypothetical protein